MGVVDLKFKPSAQVFDANMTLGRRHDKKVNVDTIGDTIKAMDYSGVDRALVYAPHAALHNSDDDNRIILAASESEPRLVPQFVCNPTFDNLNSFLASVEKGGVRSVRMFPHLHNYPFEDWVVKPWLNGFANKKLPLWMKITEFDRSEFHRTIKAHPDVTVVLSEVHYSNYSWTMPLLRSLPNLYIEISRFVIHNGILKLIEAIGENRILFGSNFPESEIGSQLYNLYHCGLDEKSAETISAGNLDRLLREGV